MRVYRGWCRHLWTRRAIIDSEGREWPCECSTWGRLKRLLTLR